MSHRARSSPLAERTGIIEALGDWVLRALCRQAAAWEAEGLTPKLGMNVSPRQLRRRGYAARLAAEVAAHGIAPERIVFELTESAWVRSGEALLPVFAAVRDAGFTFAIDDFGAGYSSLSRLRDLPADIIKVDRGVPARRAGRPAWRPRSSSASCASRRRTAPT